MHICDTCRYYNKCYPKTMNTYDEFIKKVEVELGGCPCYDELTINELSRLMFMEV